MPVDRVFCGGKEIVLVGTAHLSRESIRQVKEAIEKEKPDAVGVELDKQRFTQLVSQQKWLDMDLARVVREGKTYLFLINILLANMQRKLGEELGLKPGMEMVEAIEASKAGGIPVGLLDRDVSVTLKRALNEMSMVEKAKLLFEIVLGIFHKAEPLTEDAIEELKEKDTLNALLEELSRKMPSVKKVLVDERDAFIADRIMGLGGRKVLAVVGMGHIEGVKRHLGKKVDTMQLLSVPQKKSRLRYLKFGVPIALLAIIGYGFYSKGAYAAAHLFLLWFIINGVLSAAGAALAKAHPLSIATAFLAAPFTSLHPALAAGWFAAAAEMKVRCPKVRDFEELKGLESYRDFSNNRVTRVLLVAAYSNLGSTIGTIVALPYILALLG
jgi:pheromone shutdown-related protein TraB